MILNKITEKKILFNRPRLMLHILLLIFRTFSKSKSMFTSQENMGLSVCFHVKLLNKRLYGPPCNVKKAFVRPLHKKTATSLETHTDHFIRKCRTNWKLFSIHFTKVAFSVRN